MIDRPTSRQTQDAFANETSAQRFDHRVISQKYRRREKLHPNHNVRIRDLERFILDRYGSTLPNDDAGAEDALTMLHHLAHRRDPERRMRIWLRDHAPEFSEGLTCHLIGKAMRRPLKWKADKLGALLGLTDATRERLGITTIGAIDCTKAERETRRKEEDAARHRELREKAGAKPQTSSAARNKPWEPLGISKATYYRKGLNEPGETTSSAAYILTLLQTKQSHVIRRPVAAPCQMTDAPPPQGGVLARAVPALPHAETVVDTDRTLSPRVFPTAARARGFSLTSASSM